MCEQVRWLRTKYDAGTYGVGRLTSITDESGQMSLSYDHRGNVTQDSRIVDGQSYVVDYTYDLADNIQTMTYPSGRTITFTRDTAGRVTSIKEGATVLVENVLYHPFGRPKSWDYGNGLTQVVDIDTDGRVDEWKVLDGSTELHKWSYNYDDVHNIDDITKDGTLEDYNYDDVYRLKDQTPIGQSQISYTYDGVGNRKSETQGVNSKTYSYEGSSNRLISDDGQAINYDDAGNVVSDDNGNRVFTYNRSNRLSAIHESGLLRAEYSYNSSG
ncbi:MAG: RHS repeat domain-containing protein, partial [Pseudomonadota bacterium]